MGTIYEKYLMTMMGSTLIIHSLKTALSHAGRRVPYPAGAEAGPTFQALSFVLTMVFVGPGSDPAGRLLFGKAL
jgi:hypothetical protein